MHVSEEPWFFDARSNFFLNGKLQWASTDWLAVSQKARVLDDPLNGYVFLILL